MSAKQPGTGRRLLRRASKQRTFRSLPVVSATWRMMECTSLLLLYRSSQTATSSGATRLRTRARARRCTARHGEPRSRAAAGGAPLAEIDVSLVFVNAQHHDGLHAPNLAAHSKKQV